MVERPRIFRGYGFSVFAEGRAMVLQNSAVYSRLAVVVENLSVVEWDGKVGWGKAQSSSPCRNARSVTSRAVT